MTKDAAEAVALNTPNGFDDYYVVYAKSGDNYNVAQYNHNSGNPYFSSPSTKSLTELKALLSGGADVYVIGTISEAAAPTTYTVTFNANGGSGTHAAATGILGTYTLPTTTTFTAPTGKVFDGWSMNGSKITTATINVTQNVDLYALWKDHEHSFASTWSYDATNHWHACTVTGNSDSCLSDTGAAKAAHSGGTATCQAKAQCSTCGQEYGAFAGHSWGAWNSTTGTRACQTVGCSATETCSHTGVAAGTTCGTCGKAIPASQQSQNTQSQQSSSSSSASTTTPKTETPKVETPQVEVPVTYTVVKGDTLSQIAQRNGISLKKIIELNPQIKDPNKIKIGQIVNVGTKMQDSSANTATTTTTTGSEYTVVKGDTLTKIARRNHIKLAEIVAKNPDILDINKIFVGQKIKL